MIHARQPCVFEAITYMYDVIAKFSNLWAPSLGIEGCQLRVFGPMFSLKASEGTQRAILELSQFATPELARMLIGSISEPVIYLWFSLEAKPTTREPSLSALPIWVNERMRQLLWSH